MFYVLRSTLYTLRLVMRGFYRLWQFGQGVLARISEQDRNVVAEVLPVAAAQLFFQLPVDAQRHSLNVLRDMRVAGNLHPDLAVAALLHDIGKVEADRAGVAIRLWLRGPLVLLKTFSPTIYQTLASNQPSDGWRYALFVYQAHPQIGAAWAKEVGCSACACWLIEHHQTPLSMLESSHSSGVEIRAEEKELLKMLQWADEKN